jgi:hypothetical protein
MKALKEFQHLKDLNIAEELMGPLRDLPTGKVCNKMPSTLSFVWTSTQSDGYISKEDLSYSLQRFMGKFAKVGKNSDAMRALLAEVIMNVVDQDHDGRISRREFCMFGAAIQREFDHYIGLAKRFSQQLLNSSAPCTKYGAFYVLRGARNASSPKWQTGACCIVREYIKLTLCSRLPGFVDQCPSFTAWP